MTWSSHQDFRRIRLTKTYSGKEHQPNHHCSGPNWRQYWRWQYSRKTASKIRNLLQAKPPLVEPSEPIYEVKILGKTEAQKKNRDVHNQEKRVGWKNHVIKAREKGVLYNSFRWDEADAKVRSYLFLCLGAERQRQIQQKRPNWQLHTVTTIKFVTTWRHFRHYAHNSFWEV